METAYRDEKYRKIAGVLANEPKDPDWDRDFRDSLTRLNPEQLSGVHDVECGTTICRVELTFATSHEVDVVLDEFTPDVVKSGTISKRRNPDGTWSARAFFGKEVSSLSRSKIGNGRPPGW